MAGDEVKPSLRSGKLSLKRRRREKRKSGESNEDSSALLNSKRSKRAPIPSFSPLNDDCSFLFGNDEKETSSSGPHKTAKKANISPHSNKDAEYGMQKTNASKPIHQLKRALKDLNKARTVERDVDAKKTSRQPIANFHKKENTEAEKQDLKKVKDTLPKDTAKRCSKAGLTSVNCAVNSIGSAEETMFDDSAKTHLRSKRSNPQQEKEIGSDNCGDNALHVVAMKTDTHEHTPISNEPLPMKCTSTSNKVKDIKLIEVQSEIIAMSTPVTAKDSILPPSKKKQQTLTHYSGSSKSTSTMNDVLPNPSPDSPEFKDFNVPRAKFLADRESNLNKKHCNLLQQSNNGRLNKKVTAKRSKTSNTVQYGRSSGAKQCTLCATCSCSRGSALQSLEDSAISEHQNPLQRLARSDAEIERALIGRLARLEKSASWFDGLCTKVHRDLKRHRNKIKAKMQEADVTDRPKFLRDVDLDDEEKTCAPPLPKYLIDRAMNRTFSFRKKAQPTLTQMLGDKNDDEQSGETEKVEIIMKEGDIVSEEELDSKNSEVHEAEDDFVDYNGACHKGQSRSFWGASRMSEEQLQESNIMQDFEPIDSDERALERKINYDDDGLSELLNAFETIDGDGEESNGFVMKHVASSNLCEASTLLNNKDSKSMVTFSQLSPFSKSTYSSLKLKVEENPVKIEILNGECPGWRENMRFALRQNPDELTEALANVKSKRERVAKAVQMLEKQSTVLEVFQLTLQESLARYDASSNLDSILEE